MLLLLPPPATLSECATSTSSVAPALTLFLGKGMGGEREDNKGGDHVLNQKANRVECTFSNRREAQRILWRIPALLIPPIFFFLFSSCFLYVLHTLLSALYRPPAADSRRRPCNNVLARFVPGTNKGEAAKKGVE